MITHHTDLLNALIEKYNLKSYLEIGVQDPKNNFDKVKCLLCCGVDPEIKEAHYKINGYYKNLYSVASDKYFDAEVNYLMQVDLIFIDGLHHAEQVKRDFENSLRCLSDNGFIVIHDVLPENEEGTIVPRQTKRWWGDVYKWAMTIGQYTEIQYKTFNIDNGCMLVWRCPKRLSNPASLQYPMTWGNYLLHGRTLMNVTDEVNI